MAGRPKIFDPREVLEKAREVFRKKGYEATSTADLCEAMGIGKGSFYQEFEGGKQQVFEKAVCTYARAVAQRLDARLRESENPVAEIKQIFLDLAAASAEEHRMGCFTGNTLVEMAGNNPYLEDMAVSLFKESEAVFLEALKRAKANGQLGSQADPELLAKSLLTFWHGFNLTRRMYPEQQVLAAIIDTQLAILQ